MKRIIHRCNPRIISELKNRIYLLKSGETEDILWAVTGKITDPTGKETLIDPVLSVSRRKYRYKLRKHFLFNGMGLIKTCCKSLKIKWLWRHTGWYPRFSYDEICKIIDEMPKHWDDYANDYNFVHCVDFNKNTIKSLRKLYR